MFDHALAAGLPTSPNIDSQVSSAAISGEIFGQSGAGSGHPSTAMFCIVLASSTHALLSPVHRQMRSHSPIMTARTTSTISCSCAIPVMIAGVCCCSRLRSRGESTSATLCHTCNDEDCGVVHEKSVPGEPRTLNVGTARRAIACRPRHPTSYHRSFCATHG